MVRFQENALIIEIPCVDADAVDYYEDLQKALYEVFWLANGKGGIQYESISWIANYLGPAVAALDPHAKQVLSQLAQKQEGVQPLCAKSRTNEEILTLLKDLPISRFQQIMSQFEV
ncbi:hypothetical protein WBJ53_08670 [Spirosoma sp. SC4-14]|uniref:hypothetical protein n=1 Tax=Spirosoma sp. SC4-14 TaxID=3128900 RepID=UPI0030D17D70